MRIAAQRAPSSRLLDSHHLARPTGVDDDGFAGTGAADDVAIHPEWADLELGDVEGHRALSLTGRRG